MELEVNPVEDPVVLAMYMNNRRKATIEPEITPMIHRLTPEPGSGMSGALKKPPKRRNAPQNKTDYTSDSEDTDTRLLHLQEKEHH